MKILFLTHEIPFPPNNGIRIVSYNAMRIMHDKGHDICLCTLTSEQSEPDNSLSERYASMSGLISPKSFWIQAPKQSRLNQIMDTLSGKLTFLQQFKVKEFENKLINTLIDFKPDVVHFDGISMTQYINCLPVGVGSIASINDCHTLTLYNNLASGIFTGFTRWIKKFQLKRTKHYEASKYALFDYVHLMTEVDALFLREMNPKIKTWVIANGVENKLFSINDTAGIQNDIVFVGALTKNNLYSLKRFIEEGWPIIKNHPSSPTLKVVGKVTEQAKEWITKISAAEEKIEFVGYVSKLTDAYENKAIAVVPINKTSGIINKAIEAMAAGLAVIGFSSAFEGMSYAEAGVHYMSGNSYGDLGRCILQLLDDPVLRLNIANAGRELSVDHHTWSSKESDYEAMYLSAEHLAKS